MRVDCGIRGKRTGEASLPQNGFPFCLWPQGTIAGTSFEYTLSMPLASTEVAT